MKSKGEERTALPPVMREQGQICHHVDAYMVRLSNTGWQKATRLGGKRAGHN